MGERGRFWESGVREGRLGRKLPALGVGGAEGERQSLEGVFPPNTLGI